jgi:kynurenine formamidase
VLTVHHWPDRAQCLAELRRVARDRVVILTWAPDAASPPAPPSASALSISQQHKAVDYWWIPIDRRAAPRVGLGAALHPRGLPMSRFIDLSVTVDENTFSPPSTNMKLEVTPHRRGPGFWQVSSVHQSLHTGAHIDSPLHVFKNGITTAEISLDQVMGEALVVDLSGVGANHAITIDDLKKGGAGDVKRGDIVLLHTGWTDKMYGRWPDYFTQSPYFPPEVAQWLVDRGPKNIGFDFFEEYCARLPEFTSEDFAMHRVILGAGVVIMEGLTNLGALPRRRVEFAAPFYKIAGTEGAPARFFATV